MLPKTPSSQISVAIVEDDAITRKILSAVIESDSGLQLLASFENVTSALAWLETACADVVLVDLRLKDGLGIEVIRSCTRYHPACDAVVLTSSSEDKDVAECIAAGARGYLLKEDGACQIVRAIQELRFGGSPVSPLIARKILDQLRNTEKVKVTATEEEKNLLSKREVAVLQLIARGCTYEEIAQNLSISIMTVQNHIKSIYSKLSVNSRGKAVFEAQQRGLLEQQN
ncbi:MAG TPA: response regulator transcription factor [Burkholderiaceae bacterium]|jgi:DNA-binding NarL/FixJ family response regulator